MEKVVALPVAGPLFEFNDEVVEYGWCFLEMFIKEQVEKLEGQIRELEQAQSRIQAIDSESPRLRQRIKAAGVRAWSVEQLRDLWIEVSKPERDASMREIAIAHLASLNSRNLKYYFLINYMNNRVDILADNPSVVRYIAWQNGRITDRKNGKVFLYSEEKIEKMACGDAINSAIKAGWPGVIEIMGERVLHKDRKVVF